MYKINTCFAVFIILTETIYWIIIVHRTKWNHYLKYNNIIFIDEAIMLYIVFIISAEIRM